LGDDSYFFDPNSCENMILVDEGDHRHRLHLNGNTREINRTTLPVALFKQLEKIINFNNARVGEYKLETLYRLLCFINNVTIQSIPSRQILIGYIEELISTIH
jgi:hypothetical protein